MNEQRKRIGVYGSQVSPGQRRLLAALADIFGVYIDFLCDSDVPKVDAWIIPDAAKADLDRIANSRVACFVSISVDNLIANGESTYIGFSTNTAVPDPFKGRTVQSADAKELGALPPWLTFLTPLAEKSNMPVWGIAGPAALRHHFTVLPIPELEDGGLVHALFDGNSFLALLPLLSFLRQTTEDWRWEPPPTRACFMFDDPNLHWPTYGYIRFGDLVKHARHHRYHVASATIPLDSWFVHKPTAALFKESSDAVTLLLHGNDHVSGELARVVDGAARQQLLNQAIARIERLEKRSGVNVCRIMAPPHGACSEEMLAQMSAVGIEAACISRGSLAHYNRGAPWIHSIGMRPSDIVRGMPVLSRFRIARDCQNAILIAAFLRQPIVPVGHHQDVADGLGLFSTLAEFINSFAGSRWGSMSTIARSHFSRKLHGPLLSLRMHSKKIEFLVPDDVHGVVVERPWLTGPAVERLTVEIDGAATVLASVECGRSIAVKPGQRICVTSGVGRPIRSDNPQVRLRLWPFARRLLTESRDRMAPVLRRLSRSSKQDYTS